MQRFKKQGYAQLRVMQAVESYPWKTKKPEILRFQAFSGGDKRDRTADLLNAIQALSQLSYTPRCLSQRVSAEDRG